MKLGFLLVIACLIAIAAADFPMHCLHSQIRGEWLVYKAPLEDRDEPQKCMKIGMNDVTDIVTLNFKSPNVVLQERKRVGVWTMVYDQGFEFTVGNEIYFAFNKFTKNETTNKVTSFCGETSYGWYRNKNQHGCYFARRTVIRKNDTQTSLPVNTLLYLNKDDYEKINTHKNDIELVDSINNEEETWRAEAYSFWENMSDDDITRISGIKLEKPAVERILLDSKLNQERVLSDEELDVDSMRRSMLPKNWDWRNVNGVNYVGDVRDQKSCGSCYAFAATAAIESRIRIKTNNTIKSVISPQQVISCSDYNQACSGGFPYMVGKHGYDFYLVPEECSQYKGEKRACNETCTNPEYRVKIQKYEYIGGYYGANTELGMMEEIYKNGPIPVNYLVYPDFRYYKKGIYKHHHKRKTLFNKKTSRRGVKHWEATTHAVVVVGYGENEKTGDKYWICKNSWGAQWGMEGYFLIRRGVDECAIEMQASALDPIIIKNDV